MPKSLVTLYENLPDYQVEECGCVRPCMCNTQQWDLEIVKDLSTDEQEAYELEGGVIIKERVPHCKTADKYYCVKKLKTDRVVRVACVR